MDNIKRCKFIVALEHLNAFLLETKYAAGDHLTIADLTLLASGASMKVMLKPKSLHSIKLFVYQRPSTDTFLTIIPRLQNGWNAAKLKFLTSML